MESKVDTTVKIGWKQYTVSSKSSVIRDGVECYGCIDYANPSIIELSSKNTSEQNKVTLLHEIIHGVDNMFNINLKESEVLALANGLYGVFVDNPHIFNMTLNQKIGGLQI